jgi:hypothetical protein
MAYDLFWTLTSDSEIVRGGTTYAGGYGPYDPIAAEVGDILNTTAAHDSESKPQLQCAVEEPDNWSAQLAVSPEVDTQASMKLIDVDELDLMSGIVNYVDPHQENLHIFSIEQAPDPDFVVPKGLVIGTFVRAGRKAIIRKGFSTITPRGTQFTCEMLPLHSHDSNADQPYYVVCCKQGEVELESWHDGSGARVYAKPSTSCRFVSIAGVPDVY